MGIVDDIKHGVNDAADSADDKMHEMKGQAEGYQKAQDTTAEMCNCGKEGCTCAKGECNC